MEQLGFSFAAQAEEAAPDPRRAEPAVWISRVLILRAPRVSEETVIRDLRLRRGLNVLWAPPSPGGAENRLFEGRITGHTAGKTTFCRLIRYLLGEARFGAARTQDRIRARLPEGWVAGEVRVGGAPWVVGRPFGLGVHPFAARGGRLEEALEAREGYPEFLAALDAATAEALPVRTLPHAGRPIDWPLLLTWVARDQEARFADVAAWRDPASQSESPSPKVADRHVAIRAALELMSDEEGELLGAHESLKQQKKQLEDEARLLGGRADEDRRRLAARLGLGPDEGSAGPLFADRLRKRVEADRAAVARAEEALEPRQGAVEAAFEAFARAAEEAAVRRARLRDAEQARGARGSDQGDPPRDAPAGRCNVLLSIAAERGCPLAAAAPAREDAGALERREAAARHAFEEAEAEHTARRDEYLRQNAELQEERASLARRRAAIEEMKRLHGHLGGSQRTAQANEDARKHVAAEAEALAKRKAARQREHAEALGRLSARFQDVVQALLGRSAGGRAEVLGGEVELHIAENGERDGAAMETLKVLAFDLAALALSIDGHGGFPGLLIHDGPREADMDETIYERLFLYAEELERRAPGEPRFQYLVTTTAPPPARLQGPPWLLEPRLDASVPEGRLLGLDL